jgi:hypothetical protein
LDSSKERRRVGDLCSGRLSRTLRLRERRNCAAGSVYWLNADHPTINHPTINHHPATDHPATDHPATDHPATDHPATDNPATDNPAT